MAQTPRVRCATASDLDGVLALYRELRPHDPPLAPARARALWQEVAQDRHSRIVVAEVEGGRIGATCMLATVANLASGGARIGVIEHVITAATCRRQGLARQVLAHALELAWTDGCCKVLLLSGAQREEAHQLYAAVGFRGDVERGFVAKPPQASLLQS